MPRNADRATKPIESEKQHKKHYIGSAAPTITTRIQDHIRHHVGSKLAGDHLAS